jgi:hypothetical protein
MEMEEKGSESQRLVNTGVVFLFCRIGATDFTGGSASFRDYRLMW